jgi:hypothetical protein
MTGWHGEQCNFKNNGKTMELTFFNILRKKGKAHKVGIK